MHKCILKKRSRKLGEIIKRTAPFIYLVCYMGTNILTQRFMITFFKRQDVVHRIYQPKIHGK